MVDDANIRWGDKNPSPSQRAMEGLVESAIAKLVGCDREHIEAAMFVEGIRSEFPVTDDVAVSSIANAMFEAYRRLAGGFGEPADIPATLFLVGCGPEQRLVWRIVSGAFSVLSDVAVPLSLRFGASHTILMHAACVPLGSNGAERLNAAEYALVQSIMSSGGDPTALPYGFAVRCVCRSFRVGREGAREAATYWIQGTGSNDERSAEPSAGLDSQYNIVNIGPDGKPEPVTPEHTAEA